MPDRGAELEALVDELAEHRAIADAWVAKSFTDQLVVLDARTAELPSEVTATLAEHGLRGANEVYDTEARSQSFAGSVDGVARHQFVDMRTRGEHQSYVVD